MWTLGNKLSVISWDSLFNLRKEEKTELVHQIVDEMPTFKREQDSLSVFLQAKLKEKGINNGKAFVRLIVRKNGQLADIELLKADNEFIGEATLKILSSMPDWIPGKQNGKPVDVQIIIPVGYGFKYP